MEALTFLQTVAAATRAQTDGSADRPLMIGTIDPAYVSSSFPGTMPKVTFDGESTLSGKQYAVILPGYRPTAGDRVVLVPVGTTYAIIGSVTATASGYIGGTLTVGGAVTAPSVTVNGFSGVGGYVEYGNTTAGLVAASVAAAEAAIPTASWAHEPALTFVNGRIYRVDAQFGLGINNSTATVIAVRVRKGAQTTAGQQLLIWGEQEISNASYNERTRWGFIKNVSGANITTALSLTVQRLSAANDARLYGDTTCVLQVTIQDCGLASSHPLANLATAIV